MNKKPDAADGRREAITMRVEGSALVDRLRELLRSEPDLKLEIVAPRTARTLHELKKEIIS